MPFQPMKTPRKVRKTGDDKPVKSIWGFVIRMTGRAQVTAMFIAVLTTVLALAPIELQRRVIDDAIANQDGGLLIRLAVIYVALILIHQVFKLMLQMLQGWMTASTVAYTRKHLWSLCGDRRDEPGGNEIVAVLTSEVEALGGFAGAGPSRAASNLSMLIGAMAYMFWVDPAVALVGLLLIAPQVAVAPIMQKRLNRLVEVRLRLMRKFSSSISSDETLPEKAFALHVRRIFRNRMAFYLWKFLMKSMLNLMNAAAPLGVLLVGGWMVVQGDTSLGVVVAFVGGFGRLGDPIRQLISFYREAAQATVQHRMIAKWMTDKD
jgi:ABC-type multidrug transport system fused ATPase/permease subunit